MVGGDKMLDFWKAAMASTEDLGELGTSSAWGQVSCVAWAEGCSVGHGFLNLGEQHLMAFRGSSKSKSFL